MSLLSVNNLTVGYGEAVVIEGVNLMVEEGEVVCLLGANGAGKTTMMSALAGTLRPRSGTIAYDGQDLLRMRLHERVAAGVILCPEGRKVFPSLSVEENLFLGSFHRAARRSRQQRLAEVYNLFPVLAERRSQYAGSMSGGEQQMLALGRALMANPRLLLLDEPSLGLAPQLVQQVFGLIRRIAASRISILLVEQNSRAALGVASRGYVLTAGRIVLTDAAAGLRDTQRLQKAFLGEVREADAKPGLA
jgi:branched-chain amino acid transport system ATP-binding protein